MLPGDTRGIVHVAAASEDRGRVVLHVRSGNPSPVAIAAAARLARAFGAAIESVFVEDQQLIDLAAHGFIREVSRWSGEPRVMSPDAMAQDLASEARAAQRRIAALAEQAEVPLRQRVMRDEPMRAIAVTCAECGPWNVIVLAEPFAGRGGIVIAELLREVSATTGVVVVGPRAGAPKGPVLVVVEDAERLPQLVRAAQRLAAEAEEEVALLVFGSTSDEVADRESHVRLALEDASHVVVHTAIVVGDGHAAAAEIVRRHGASIVLAQLGGIVLPLGDDLAELAQALSCPLFVVR